MKRGRLQCKDIPTQPILDYLATNGGIGCSHWASFERSVRKVMPPEVNDNLAQAKMSSLMRKKLVNGCDCGCRGDWELAK